MKKRILALLLVIVVISITSCVNIFGDVADTGKVTVVIENLDKSYDVYEVNLKDVDSENKKEGAKGIIDHLSERDENALSVVMVDSAYGAYVNEIGSLKNNEPTGYYIMVYTSVESDAYLGDNIPTVNYKDTILYQSNAGISVMKIEPGTVILFRSEFYG